MVYLFTISYKDFVLNNIEYHLAVQNNTEMFTPFMVNTKALFSLYYLYIY